jgi:hypothetical protein
MLTTATTDVEAASSLKEEGPAEITDRLDKKLRRALDRALDLRALGCALIHLLNDAKGIDDETLITALYLAGMVEKQGAALANRIDIISLEFADIRRDIKAEAERSGIEGCAAPARG